jgi:axial budding pattern protein 2
MLILFLSAFAAVTVARVSVVNPIADQLPLIGRVNSTYTWSLSSQTFSSMDGTALIYTTTPLPSWLSFNSTALEFSGTPLRDEEIEIIVTARNDEHTASSPVTLKILSTPAPSVELPIASQFSMSNPSMSSVFPLSSGSALSTSNPALRIPSEWSFSVGFQWNTVNYSGKFFYKVLQSDGTPLPSWTHFNPSTITLNGVTPYAGAAPRYLSLALHASEHEGYSSVILPFDLVIATHELSTSMPSLPTINVTSGTPFSLSLNSPADLVGIVLDGQALRPPNISELLIDTSAVDSWLKYDVRSRVLSGVPTNSTYAVHLPVSLTAANQTLRTEVTLTQVPSFFSVDLLPSMLAESGRLIDFNLNQFVANDSTLGADSEVVSLSASVSPDDSSRYVTFNAESGHLTGLIPDGDLGYSQITVTFAAYSTLTHSTSHASMNIMLVTASYEQDQDTNSGNKNHRTTLGLGIAGAILGGMVLFGILLAAFRRYAKPEDQVVGGEQGRRGYSLEEKKWYGIEEGHSFDTDVRVKTSEKSARGSPDITSGRSGCSQGSSSRRIRNIFARLRPGTDSDPQLKTAAVDAAKLSRKLTSEYPDAPGQLDADQDRRTIDSPFDGNATRELAQSSADIGLRLPIASACLTSSKNISTASSIVPSGSDLSVPRRRADFGPPRSSSTVRTGNMGHSRSLSIVSLVSSADTESTTASHAIEAVVQRASRKTSILSRESVSGVSFLSLPDGTPAMKRPRLVPFTSASRVPAPSFVVKDKRPSLDAEQTDVRSLAGLSPDSAEIVPVDVDLSVGVHYIRSLGEDVDNNTNATTSTSAVFYTEPPVSTATPSAQTRASVGSYSLASSFYTQRGPHASMTHRILVRENEKFRYRLPALCATKKVSLSMTLMDGSPIPSYIRTDWGQAVDVGSIEFSGIPSKEDIGELNIGIFDDHGECIARVIIEIVSST